MDVDEGTIPLSTPCRVLTASLFPGSEKAIVCSDRSRKEFAAMLAGKASTINVSAENWKIPFQTMVSWIVESCICAAELSSINVKTPTLPKAADTRRDAAGR